MFYLWAAAGAVGMVLQVLVVAVLWRGAWRQYKVLFCYAVVLLATSAVEAKAFFAPVSVTAQTNYYWWFDCVRQGLLYVLVISLIQGASERSAKRASIRRLLVAGAVLFAGLSLYFRHNRLEDWMTQFSRDLGFLAVLLNLILWAVLLQSGRPNDALLMISGGLGIQMAGKAIGHSLRHLSKSTVTLGDLIIVLSHLLCLYIWWQTLRGANNQTADTT